MTDDTRLEAVRTANPKRRLYTADSPAGVLILGNPKPEDYLYYRSLLQGDDAADKAKAPDTLLKACAVDPGPEAMAELLKEYPGIAGNAEVARAVSLACGITKDALAKK